MKTLINYKLASSMLELKAQEMFGWFRNNLVHMRIGKDNPMLYKIAVYTKPVKSRKIFSPEDLTPPFHSRVIIGPKEGSLLNLIDIERFKINNSPHIYGELTKIQPDSEIPGLTYYSFELKYKDDSCPAIILTEHRDISVHTHSKTLPQDLNYQYFEF